MPDTLNTSVSDEKLSTGEKVGMAAMMLGFSAIVGGLIGLEANTDSKISAGAYFGGLFTAIGGAGILAYTKIRDIKKDFTQQFSNTLRE